MVFFSLNCGSAFLCILVAIVDGFTQAKNKGTTLLTSAESNMDIARRGQICILARIFKSDIMSDVLLI